MAPNRTGKQFRNWAGNQVCLPTEIVKPATVNEVSQLVQRAAAEGWRVKAVGAGHSFTAAAMTDGILVLLDAIDQVESVDTESGIVVVGAGMRLQALNKLLDKLHPDPPAQPAQAQPAPAPPQYNVFF